MSGVSAGAICWFQNGITDSWSSNLKVMTCMNLIKGCCCPHYDEEPERKPTVKKLLNANKFNTIFAVEGGAALHVKNESIHRAIVFKKNKSAYLVSKDKGEIIEKSYKQIILI